MLGVRESVALVWFPAVTFEQFSHLRRTVQCVLTCPCFPHCYMATGRNSNHWPIAIKLGNLPPASQCTILRTGFVPFRTGRTSPLGGLPVSDTFSGRNRRKHSVELEISSRNRLWLYCPRVLRSDMSSRPSFQKLWSVTRWCRCCRNATNSVKAWLVVDLFNFLALRCRIGRCSTDSICEIRG
jgi:hypothetical protein